MCIRDRPHPLRQRRARRAVHLDAEQLPPVLPARRRSRTHPHEPPRRLRQGRLRHPRRPDHRHRMGHPNRRQLDPPHRRARCTARARRRDRSAARAARPGRGSGRRRRTIDRGRHHGCRLRGPRRRSRRAQGAARGTQTRCELRREEAPPGVAGGASSWSWPTLRPSGQCVSREDLPRGCPPRSRRRAARPGCTR